MSRTFPVAPMKATTGTLPTGPGWAYEIKWDGMRAIVEIESGNVRAHSSRLKDITASFPELSAIAKDVDVDVVLDGEIVAFDEGRPSFARLQRRIHVSDPHTVALRAAETPVVFVIFDILAIGDESTAPLPYSNRRRLLESVVPPRGPVWRLTEVHDSGGAELLETVTERGLEGLIAKRTDSRYEAGRRSSEWIKVKVRLQQEMVVGGWLSAEATAGTNPASLLVGYHDQSGLRFAGSVGSGLTDDAIDRMAPRLAELEVDGSPFVDAVPRPPRRSVHFTRPTIVVEVAFGEWTAADRMRHPVFLGERIDVDPSSVTRES